MSFGGGHFIQSRFDDKEYLSYQRAATQKKEQKNSRNDPRKLRTLLCDRLWLCEGRRRRWCCNHWRRLSYFASSRLWRLNDWSRRRRRGWRRLPGNVGCVWRARWTGSWTSIARQGNRGRIVLDNRCVRIREVAAGRQFRRSIQIHRRGAYRRIRIEGLWRYQQTAVKRAKLLAFVRKRTITLGATLHTHGPRQRESDFDVRTQFARGSIRA